MLEAIKEHADIISVAASVATVVGLFLAWLGLRQTARSVQANTLMQIHRDSRDLAEQMQEVANLIPVWKGTQDESQCPRAKEIMRMMFSHYAAIFYQWQNGTLDNRFWPPFYDEMRDFARLPYVKTNIADAKMLGPEFADFMQRLSGDV